MTRHGIIHFMFHPVAAKRFAEPLAAAAIAGGIPAELWIEPLPGLDVFRAGIQVPVQFCPSNLGFNPLKAAKTLLILLKRLSARKPLAIQAHLFRSALLPLLAARLTGVPIRIYHNHGVSYLGYQGALRFLLQVIEALNCHLATHVITVNEYLKPALQAVTNHPIAVFGPGSVCGLAPEEYAAPDSARRKNARQEFGLKNGDLVLLYIGRPNRHKGFFILLESFAGVFAGREDVHLLICGCSEADVAAALPNHPSNIRALGYRADLRPVYDAADAVVLPSLYEGLPYSLLEGAARGCALLASRIPGAEALVEADKNGFLVRPGDAGDLMRTLRSMDQERNRLAPIGAAAYEKALQFQREKIVGLYIAYLRGIMKVA